MNFADTKLPKHPTIEKTFAELKRLDALLDGADDTFTTRGVKIATLIATESKAQDPDAIAAGLLVPLASDAGARLLAQADVPPRVQAIIDAVFELGGMTMRGEPIEEFYAQQDAATRSVVLASSTRMFEVMAGEMKESLAASRKAGTAEADAKYLQGTLQPLKKFSAMICKAETAETALAQKCEDSVAAIEKILDRAHLPAAAPDSKKPPAPTP